MKILVTGAAGFIGSRLCEILSKTGHDVHGFDNLYYNQWHLVQHCFQQDNSVFYNMDCSNIDRIYLDWADVIIPLAALVGAPLCEKEPDLSQKINVDQIQNIVDKIQPNQKLIALNSNSGIGTFDGIADENTPRNSHSLYGKQKDKYEDIASTHHNTVVFRLATLFGTSWRTRVDLLVNNMVGEAVLNNEIKVFDPEFKRNFIHIDDVVQAICFSLSHWDIMKNNAYNLGNDECNMTKGQLAEKIASLCNQTFVKIGDGHDPDQRSYNVSSNKLYSLGYKPLRNLEYGIKQMIKFYQHLPKDKNIRNDVLKYNRNY